MGYRADDSERVLAAAKRKMLKEIKKIKTNIKEKTRELFHRERHTFQSNRMVF